jgi:glycosyltransferase involved in cell wall biosynthesis
LPYKVIPNFVPDNIGVWTDADNPKLKQLPEDGYLLFVGDLSEEKGVDVLFRAYAGLRDAPPLVLIGRKVSGIPNPLPENVHLMGRWPHGAVMEAWRRSSIALAPSIWAEPFGIVAIEAMASGKPVIASRIGGLTDIVIDGETGLLTPPGNVEALQSAIQYLLDHPTERERIGLAAKQRSEYYKASRVIQQIEHVYRMLLNEKTSIKPLQMTDDPEIPEIIEE